MAEQRGEYEMAEEVYIQVEQRRLAAQLDQDDGPDQLMLRARMGIVNVLDELVTRPHQCPMVMRDSRLIAVVLFQGHTQEAELLCEALCRDQAKALGPTHPDTLRSQMNMATFSIQRGSVLAAGLLMKHVEAAQVRGHQSSARL